MRPSAFDAIAAYAQAHEVNWTRDPHAEPLRFGVHHDDPAPWNQLLGPVYPRGGVSGVIWQNGEPVCQWGEPDRSDQTFSVAKAYLALLAGVAHDQGLLPDPDEPVSVRVKGIGFESAHNRSVTWTHLMSQTSEWEGSCFGVPDQVERYRKVVLAPQHAQGQKGDARPLQTPGTYWEYNDVRINQLSLALLHLMGEHLPSVFARHFLQPMGAGQGFKWEGYANSYVDLPARGGRAAARVQSVPGGTHWGGGVSISANDQAKLGQLMLNQGSWTVNGLPQQLISGQWLARMRSPVELAPFYGWLVWLNPRGVAFPGASDDSYFFFGAGGNYVWMEPAHNAVVVVRWIAADHFLQLVTQLSALFQQQRSHTP